MMHRSNLNPKRNQVKLKGAYEFVSNQIYKYFDVSVNSTFADINDLERKTNAYGWFYVGWDCSFCGIVRDKDADVINNLFAVLTRWAFAEFQGLVNRKIKRNCNNMDLLDIAVAEKIYWQNENFIRAFSKKSTRQRIIFLK